MPCWWSVRLQHLRKSAKATSIAQRILDVQTPDQIYGNSIKGNRLWNKRNLPDPTEKDFFQGNDRPTSNLYSGTEMLGALTGLEHLLGQQANQNNRGRYTYITMMTDGRPERRCSRAYRIGRRLPRGSPGTSP